MVKYVRSVLHRTRKRLFNAVRLVRNYQYDFQRFRSYASPFRELTTSEQQLSFIIMLYHSIEKGLALPQPRYHFGQVKIRMLLHQVQKYLHCSKPHPQIEAALGALWAYVAFHEKADQPISHLADEIANLQAQYDQIRKNRQETGHGGTRMVTRQAIWASSRKDLCEFFEHRYSIRQFADQAVEPDVIAEAIRMAQKSPSVCNRQSGRVYIFDNDELGGEILACQTGNAGFGHTADKILVITSSLGAFLSVGERNQCWIDGGLFAMTLVYALHSLGLGTCCLNWSVEYEQDRRLREVAGIRDSENIIMLLAVGHLPERFRVAYSQRNLLDEVATFRTSKLPSYAATTTASREELSQTLL